MSLGGKTTQTQSIDPDLKAASLANLQMAQKVGQLGFVPYQGATVAGLQPAQIAAMQNTNTGLGAFGLGGSPIPAAGDLSPYAIYQQQLAQMAPGQRAFIDSMFINPLTGAAPASVAAAQAQANAAATAAQRAGQSAVEYGRGGEQRSSAAGSRTATGGYNSVRDMIDGGGPGRSGTTFSGGGRVSAAANRAGISPVDGRGKNASGARRGGQSGK